MATKNMEQTYLAHTYLIGSDTEKAFLAHHGILGMKWGVRRYQNKDGSLTDAGKKRLLKNIETADKKTGEARARANAEIHKTTYSLVKQSKKLNSIVEEA